MQALYEDNLHLELMAKLLSTERQFHIMSRRAGLYEALESCIESCCYLIENPIAEAIQDRNIQKSAATGEIGQVKDWAALKFGGGRADS